MKKNKKNIKPEAIYDASIILETTDILFKLLEILNSKEIIQNNNFFYLFLNLDSYNEICEEFNKTFFKTNHPKIKVHLLNKKEYISEAIVQKRLLNRKFEVLVKYSKKNNANELKKISIEILEFMNSIYNQRIENLRREIDDVYDIVPLTEIFIILEDTKKVINQ
jgi:hypothetical protein